MKNCKKIVTLFLCVILLFVFPLTVFAHSGRTDSSGGHHDYKNKSGLGSYHYHHGYPAHLHPNGVCPYDGSASMSTSSGGANIQPKPSIEVNGVSTTMNVGEICGFDAIITNTSDTDIQVTSSNSDVVFINVDKTLTAKSAGTSTVTIGNETVS